MTVFGGRRDRGLAATRFDLACPRFLLPDYYETILKPISSFS